MKFGKCQFLFAKFQQFNRENRIVNLKRNFDEAGSYRHT